MFKLLPFALFIFLTSCTTNVSDEDAFGMVDVDQNYTEKDIFSLELDALKDSEKMPEGLSAAGSGIPYFSNRKATESMWVCSLEAMFWKMGSPHISKKLT